MDQSSPDGNHATKTGIGGLRAIFRDFRPDARLQSAGVGAEVPVFLCLGDVALTMLAVPG